MFSFIGEVWNDDVSIYVNENLYPKSRRLMQVLLLMDAVVARKTGGYGKCESGVCLMVMAI